LTNRIEKGVHADISIDEARQLYVTLIQLLADVARYDN
jgi:hypothetical protein